MERERDSPEETAASGGNEQLREDVETVRAFFGVCNCDSGSAGETRQYQEEWDEANAALSRLAAALSVSTSGTGARRAVTEYGETLKRLADEDRGDRCPETTEGNLQCIHQAGHTGDHFAKDSYSYYTWS